MVLRGAGSTRRALLLAGAFGLAGAARGTARAQTIVEADRIVVLKRQRELLVMRGGERLYMFRCAIGYRPHGPKVREGDGRTPEGSYVISAFLPHSEFHRALQISYPNAYDLVRAETLGARPGGRIMIHGLDPALRRRASYHWMFNWTNGCIALTDPQIDIVWQSVEIGTPVEIRP
jgi:murein L,D-transpeptidase YafK